MIDLIIGDTPEQSDVGILINGELWTGARIADLTRQNSELERLAKHRSESIDLLLQKIEITRQSYNEALEYASKIGELEFINCWMEGYWHSINEEWPEFNLQSEAQLNLMKESGFDPNQLRQQAKGGE